VYPRISFDVDCIVDVYGAAVSISYNFGHIPYDHLPSTLLSIVVVGVEEEEMEDIVDKQGVGFYDSSPALLYENLLVEAA
jgi:hypothetical protein